MLKEEVDAEDIAEVVSKWTGVPVSALIEGEMAKLVHLEELLHRRVIGQDEAVIAVSNAIRRTVPASAIRTGRSARSCSWAPPASARPSWLGRWPSSCSTTSERWSASTWVSTWRSTRWPASSVRRPATSATTRAGSSPKRSAAGPYTVVLLDEIEKAHPDVFNVLLQVLDDGRLTDGQGRTVDFTNTVLIMTSNLPGDPLAFFKPEFINRVDEIIRFRSLTEADLARIVDIQLGRCGAHGRPAHRARGHPTPPPRFAHEGYDPGFGARPLKRVIQREISDPVASLILAGKVGEGGHRRCRRRSRQRVRGQRGRRRTPPRLTRRRAT